jgi:predicted amidophosphoribosyltransferase
MACSKCGHKIDTKQFPLGLAFCPYCGEKLEVAQPTIPFCPYCGVKLPGSVKFCPECGKQLSLDKAPSPLLNPREACLPENDTTEEPPFEMETPEPEECAAPSQPIWPKVKMVFSASANPLKGW